MVNCAITFLESMLGPQMAAEPIKATQGQIGINFLVGAVAYMVASFTGGLVSVFFIFNTELKKRSMIKQHYDSRFVTR